MAYASSIQTFNDANGTAYAFLESDGLLWQCQWNPQAERWDKAKVMGLYTTLSGLTIRRAKNLAMCEGRT